MIKNAFLLSILLLYGMGCYSNNMVNNTTVANNAEQTLCYYNLPLLNELILNNNTLKVGLNNCFSNYIISGYKDNFPNSTRKKPVYINVD